MLLSIPAISRTRAMRPGFSRFSKLGLKSVDEPVISGFPGCMPIGISLRTDAGNCIPTASPPEFYATDRTWSKRAADTRLQRCGGAVGSGAVYVSVLRLSNHAPVASQRPLVAKTRPRLHLSGWNLDVHRQWPHAATALEQGPRARSRASRRKPAPVVPAKPDCKRA